MRSTTECTARPTTKNSLPFIKVIWQKGVFSGIKSSQFKNMKHHHSDIAIFCNVILQKENFGLLSLCFKSVFTVNLSLLYRRRKIKLPNC